MTLTKERSVWWATLAIVALALAGCGANAPVIMPMNYPSAAEAAPTAPAAMSRASGACAVRIAEVRDQRTDPHLLGDTTRQPVRVEDSGAWIRSAVQSLNGASGFRFVDQPVVDGGELVLNVELLKAYTMHMATDRAATVVIKVKYSRHGAPIDEQIYRGAENSVNWSNGASETRASLNTALGKILPALNKDILRYCPMR